ncbi:MAG: XrtA/PEP-CTERM system histidine kinase PrsK [bacterium]
MSMKRQKNLFYKTLVWGTPWVVTLLLGTLLLVMDVQPNLKLWGAKAVLISLCLLVPLSTQLALSFGNSAVRESQKRYKPILYAQWFLSAGCILLLATKQFLSVISSPTENVIFVFGLWGRYLLIYLIVSSMLILAILENKFRAYRHVKEIRIPILLFLTSFVLFIIMASQGLLIHRLNVNFLLLISLAVISGYLLLGFARFRNFVQARQLAVNREVLYSSFMTLLVGAYLILIGLIGKLMMMIGADVQLFFTIITACVLVFLLFMVITSFSIKASIRNFVDKAFFRGKYDYRSVWSQFSERIAFSLSLEELNLAILNSIAEIYDAKTAALLLLDPSGSRLVLAKKKMLLVETLEFSLRDHFVQWLWRLGQPVVLTQRTNKNILPDSFDAVKRQFGRLQARVCVPLATKKGLLGLLVLGDKPDNADYSREDLELLESLANQSAVAIQNLQLREEVLKTRELESFYKLSSFVVHDVRNTVSVLSMLLENARHALDDPEFRPYLLRSLTRAVDRLRTLVSKVTTVSNPREELPKETDINGLIKATLEDVNLHSGIELIMRLRRIPTILTAASQLKRVILNLVLNAAEAMPGGGRLTIQTLRGRDEDFPASGATSLPCKDYIEIVVADEGEGMTQDFIDNRLFRPFETTKKAGLGIGLYQCKEIIRSLGGRIWASSSPGAGSAFHIALPGRKAEFREEQLHRSEVFA